MSNSTIDAEAFEGCDSLYEVIAPVDLSSIGDKAFKSCTSLQTISIPTPAVTNIGKEAFSQCKQLQCISVGNECDTIETSAFTDCNSLTSLDRFSQEHAKYPFDVVGDYAFSNCGFKKLNLSLRSSTIYTFWGDNCFANNNQLEEVNFLSSCYMSTRMFANCKNLKRVNYKNNQTSYVYPYTFENCTSLASITLPSKIWYISEGMFHNCTALKEVKFNSYEAVSSMVSLVQRNAFNGCKMLSSIEFPASLNKLAYFDDACLSGIFQYKSSNVGRSYDIALNFHGIPLSDMHDSLTSDVCYGKLYEIFTDDPAAVDQFKRIDEASRAISADTLIFVSGCYRKKDGSLLYSLIPDGKSKNDTGWFIDYARSSEGKDWFAHRKCLFVHLSYVIGTLTADYDNKFYKAEQTRLTSIKKEVRTNKDYSKLPDVFKYIFTSSPFSKHFYDMFGTQYNNSGVYTYALVRINKKHVSCHFGIRSSSGISTMANTIRKTYDKNSLQVSVFIKKTNSFDDTGLFRLCHNAKVIDMHGKTYQYKYDASKEKPYVEPVNYHVDMTTKTSFKVGTWYYRAKELKDWADKTQTPCLFIYSLLGCKPCQVYQKNIWNNAGFQAWAKQQNFYLCGMEVEKQPYYDESLKFCSDELSPNAANYQKAGESKTLEPNAFGQTFKQFNVDGNYNSNLMTPVLVFYNGKTKQGFDYTFHNIDTYLLRYGADGVIQCLKSLCLYHFDNNDLSTAKFVKNAGKAFKLYDWTVSTNPYRISEDTITLNSWKPLAGKLTTANTLSKMADILKTTAAESAQYPKYIGGCLWGDIDWLQLTFDTNAMAGMSGQECNAELMKFKIQIGTKLYYLQVNEKDAKKNINTPCGIGTIYKYLFKEVK